MKTRFNAFRSFLFAAIVAVAAACASSDDPAPAPLKATTVRDLPADPTVNSGTGQPQPATGRFTLYSLATNAVVPNADSASTRWDVGFRGTVIIVNGGTSGPGQGGALIQNGIFDELKTAPATGHVQDARPNFAIPATSGQGWYSYNPQANLITPIAGRVIFLKTAEGRYAKMEILSYYKGAPATPTATDAARHYTFRYVHQPDGSTNLQ